MNQTATRIWPPLKTETLKRTVGMNAYWCFRADKSMASLWFDPFVIKISSSLRPWWNAARAKSSWSQFLQRIIHERRILEGHTGHETLWRTDAGFFRLLALVNEYPSTVTVPGNIGDGIESIDKSGPAVKARFQYCISHWDKATIPFMRVVSTSVP